MLPAEQIRAPHEAFRQERVIQGREENQQGPAPQAQADERGHLFKIGRDDLRLQPVNRIAAGAVMFPPILGPDEVLHLVTERHQPEQIPCRSAAKPSTSAAVI